MADDDYDDNEQTDDYSPRDLRQQLKAAKAEAKEAAALREQVARLERDGVIRDAGLSLNDRQRAALQATHDGTWSPDAVKKTAEELGFLTPTAAAPVVDDPSLGQIDQIAQAAAGTDAPQASRDADIDAQIAKARTPEELMAIYRSSGRPVAP